jgi:hypothetical protein
MFIAQLLHQSLVSIEEHSSSEAFGIVGIHSVVFVCLFVFNCSALLADDAMIHASEDNATAILIIFDETFFHACMQ